MAHPCTQSFPPLKVPWIAGDSSLWTNKVHRFGYNCHNMSHAQHLSKEGFLVDDAVVGCQVSSRVPHLLSNQTDQTTDLSCTSQVHHPLSAQQVYSTAILIRWCTVPLFKWNDFKSKSSSVTENWASTPRMNMESWTVSVLSVLSSAANEYKTNSLALVYSWICKSEASSSTRLVTVFRERLISANAFFFFFFF